VFYPRRRIKYIKMIFLLRDGQQQTKTKQNSQTSGEFFQSARIQLSVAKEREEKYQNHRQNRVTNRRKNLESFHDFSGFQDEEHLEGCPVKWLFRRQSNESRKKGSISKSKGVDAKTSKKPVRDKTPREIQISKKWLS